MRLGRSLLVAAMVAAFVFLAPGQTTASTVIAGSVDCGRSSGAACAYGPTLTLHSTDLGGKAIAVDVSWILDQLGRLRGGRRRRVRGAGGGGAGWDQPRGPGRRGEGDPRGDVGHDLPDQRRGTRDRRRHLLPGR